MNRLSDIKATYDWFFAQYQTELVARTKKNDIVGVEKMEEKRDVLERGFFVLMFGQFETAVNAVFQDAVSARSGNVDWSRRRGWDNPQFKNVNRVPFDTRLSMVLDRNSPRYPKILQTYAIRNHCAHGGTSEAVASIDALAADLYSWQAELKK